MENVTVTIVLHAQEVKKDKQSFIVSSANINGVWYKIKFNKQCEISPKIRGLYDLTISFDDCSVEKGKSYIGNDGEMHQSLDTIWVRKVENLRRYTDEEMRDRNRDKMSAIFGG